MDLPIRAGEQPIGVDIEEGKRYLWCSCGLSSGQPFCDGAHKGSEYRPTPVMAEATETKYFCSCKQTSNPPFCDGSHGN